MKEIDFDKEWLNLEMQGFPLFDKLEHIISMIWSEERTPELEMQISDILMRNKWEIETLAPIESSKLLGLIIGMNILDFRPLNIFVTLNSVITVDMLAHLLENEVYEFDMLLEKAITQSINFDEPITYYHLSHTNLLSLAISKQQYSNAIKLVEAGFNPNTTNSLGEISLHKLATIYEHQSSKDLVAKLLEYGADPELLCRSKNSAFSLFANHQKKEFIKIAIDSVRTDLEKDELATINSYFEAKLDWEPWGRDNFEFLLDYFIYDKIANARSAFSDFSNFRKAVFEFCRQNLDACFDGKPTIEKYFNFLISSIEKYGYEDEYDSYLINPEFVPYLTALKENPLGDNVNELENKNYIETLVSSNIFVIKGLDMNHKIQNDIFGDYLAKYVNIHAIEASKLKHDESIQEKVVTDIKIKSSSSEPLNIIVRAHGMESAGNFTIKAPYGNRYNQNMDIKLLFSSIADIAEGRVVNIIFSSCHAEILHEVAGILPIGSRVITFSSSESLTHFYDTRNDHVKEIAEILFKYGVDIYKLLELYCLSQKAITNKPIISKVFENGVQTIELTDIVDSFIERGKLEYSERMLNLFNIYDEALFDMALENVRELNSVCELQTPSDIIMLIKKAYKEGTMDELIESFKKFYQTGDLEGILLEENFNLIGVWEASQKHGWLQSISKTTEYFERDFSNSGFQSSLFDDWYRAVKKYDSCNLAPGALQV